MAVATIHRIVSPPQKTPSQKSTPHHTASQYRTSNAPTLPLQPSPLQVWNGWRELQAWRAESCRAGRLGWRGWRAGGLARLERWRESWRAGGLEGWRVGELQVWRAGGLEDWYRTAPHRQQQYLAILYRIQSQTTANRSNRGITIST